MTQTTFSTDAGYAYFDCCWLLYYSGNLSENVYLERLRFLARSTSDENLKAWICSFTQEEDTEEANSEPGNPTDTAQISFQGIVSNELPPVLQYVANLDSEKWEFHKGDDDGFHQFPMGHLMTGKTKLDPYLGWKYNHSKQIGRVSRAAVVGLWNDSKFREFATSAIGHYMAKFPRYRFRVAHPLQIPRRRG